MKETHFRKIKLRDADIIYLQDFLSGLEANAYFTQLMEELKWEQHYIKLFGKTHAQPRLTALYAENDSSYTYSGLTLQPHKFHPLLKNLTEKLKEITPSPFTHCLANLYRDGNDSMGLHSDDEKELGQNPVIASISLGATRKFRLKHKEFKDQKQDLLLEHGSLLLMQGTTQHYWKHELPRTKKEVGPRINLTFRNIIK
ncbi:alpha-ketoglutarate-dependent dioxygenase AlkB [Antarcticibacterium flavum]|uniref:Alpha-ketoglutarate-dependent dioxygenase AlkB n=1 Tax=Antarcticibacterium flavum TaxID=2058175 RepID=A0A5B7X6C6_9FLAO|nr:MULTISPECIES: alpha-ketoglutarate-dependent dioxygenase AlkB [Antarcticibacterium]MCM4159758.1 alpha-ketoglutarate-dependent dioxygenase AlkB [Antarcticibacterium sp. W02-3]QCY70690.1 alpha-ketoglutarate-dependent dioxygenase AlkB [Antarcticibacterium flavum]